MEDTKRTRICTLVNVHRVKQIAKDHGKRISPEALAMLAGHVEDRVKAACAVHDGGSKTVSATVMATVLVK